MEHPLTTRDRERSREMQDRLRRTNPYASTADRVQALREELGVGMGTAKRMVEFDDIEIAIAQAEDVEDLKPVLLRIMKLIPIG